MHKSTKHPRKNCLPKALNYQQQKRTRFAYRATLLLSLFFFAAWQEGWAATFVSNVAPGGLPKSWNTSTNWSPQGVPGPGDIITIQNGHIMELNSPISCASLTIVNTNNSTTSTLLLNGYNLTLGELTLTPNNGQRKVKLDLGSGTLKVSGTINFPTSDQSNLDLASTTGGIEFYDPSTPSALTFSATGITLPNLIFNKAQASLATNITTNGNLIIQSGTLANAGFNITGTSSKNFEIKDGAKFVLTGTTSFPGIFIPAINTGSTVEYAGGNQTIATLNYSNLKISGTGTKTPAGSITLDRAMSISNGNSLSLANGSITLGDYDLTLQQTASIAGYSTTNYIKQNGAGKLIRENIGAGGITTEVLFPIGTATSYTPAYITNTGTADHFSVKVSDNVVDNFGTQVTMNVVKKTWNVEQETTNGTANVTLKLQWNTTDEGSPFDRTKVGISHYYSNTWHQPTTFIPATAGTLPNTHYITLSGLDHFSPFGVGDILSPLPVELISFKATRKETGVHLQWLTASEKNNKGFQIQTSADGRNFEDVAFVASRNPNSATTQQYDFLDKTATATSLRYYRLKQTDLDGTVAFSEIKVVSAGKERNTPLIYPNPFSSQFSFNLQADKEETLHYYITDLSGKTVLENTQKLTKGNNNIQIELEKTHPAGFYMLHTQMNNSITINRLIKQ